MHVFWNVSVLGILFLETVVGFGVKGTRIDRRQVVQSFNPQRNASSTTTPLQVGNGNFAFGVDVTGLQTLSPFATMSTWGWHNFSLPTIPGQTSIDGLDWWTHGRLVNYNQPNPAQSNISNWLIQNPQRVNLAHIGFSFNGVSVKEEMLENKSQVLDLWSGNISSAFTYDTSQVHVETWADPVSDTIGLVVNSELLSTGSLGIFFDFPLPTRNKFDAPFVGVFNATDSHTTTLQSRGQGAIIRHDLDATTYFVKMDWDEDADISGPNEGTHRYELRPREGTKRLELSITFSPVEETPNPPCQSVKTASTDWWEDYWDSGAFIDLSSTNSSNATELQRRIILSQYLTVVNSASSYPPQESGKLSREKCVRLHVPCSINIEVHFDLQMTGVQGLTNNGWYGKFHLEMVLWHQLQFARWDKFPLLWRSLPNMYHQFLNTSLVRAQNQGYEGARWGKMTDTTGRSSPGEINSVLIWQQTHPMYFAEVEYRSFPNDTTLKNWESILTPTADFMTSYAFFNETTKLYDLGPPMYPASENTNPNATVNPAFELAYWRFGLDVAIKWKQRQEVEVPTKWVEVRDKLAPLPIADDAFAVYEGIPQMWEDIATVQDHPTMSAIFGLLPPPATPGTEKDTAGGLNMTVVRNTADKIRDLWDLEDCWGWDYPMLAMNSLRLGDVDQAIAYLLHPLFEFDDAGYVGGSRVPTPYFPGAGAFLLAMAMMAGGWDGDEGPHFPGDWDVRVEGFTPAL